MSHLKKDISYDNLENYSFEVFWKDELRALGLTEYKPLDIVRKTHGVSYNDFLWFRFPGENISSKDVLVR